jgi:translation initiation factor 2B subunit (eIF-2B alpha/beta/delta family)
MNHSLKKLVTDFHNQARKIETFEQKELINIASANRQNADKLNDLEKSLVNKIRVLEEELTLKKILINNSCIQDNLT